MVYDPDATLIGYSRNTDHHLYNSNYLQCHLDPTLMSPLVLNKLKKSSSEAVNLTANPFEVIAGFASWAWFRIIPMGFGFLINDFSFY